MQQNTHPTKTHQEEQHARREKNESDVIEVLDKAHQGLLTMKLVEGWWEVEESPRDCSNAVDGSHQVQSSSPSDGCCQKGAADFGAETGGPDGENVKERVGNEAMLHWYELREDPEEG